MKKDGELAYKRKQTRDSFRRRRQHQHRIGENTLKNSSFVPSRSGTPYVQSRSDTPDDENLFSSTSPMLPPANVTPGGSQPAIISSLDLKGLLCADASINFEDLKMKTNGAGFKRAGTYTPDGTSNIRQIQTSRQGHAMSKSSKIKSGRPSSAPASKVRGRNFPNATPSKHNKTQVSQSGWCESVSALNSPAGTSRTIQTEIDVAKDDIDKFESRVRRKKLVDTRAGTDVYSVKQVRQS